MKMKPIKKLKEAQPIALNLWNPRCLEYNFYELTKFS